MKTLSLWPSSRSVVDVQERSEYQFSSAFFAAWTAAIRRILQRAESFVNFGDCRVCQLGMMLSLIAVNLF